VNWEQFKRGLVSNFDAVDQGDGVVMVVEGAAVMISRDFWGPADRRGQWVHFDVAVGNASDLLPLEALRRNFEMVFGSFFALDNAVMWRHAVLLDSLIPYEVTATRAAIGLVVSHFTSHDKGDAFRRYIPAMRTRRMETPQDQLEQRERRLRGERGLPGRASGRLQEGPQGCGRRNRRSYTAKQLEVDARVAPAIKRCYAMLRHGMSPTSARNRD
jgi:hypothetical protein